MANNPKCIENLKMWKKGESGNPAGRPPNVRKKIKSIPKDAQVKIYGVLHHAISLPNVHAAKAYLESDEAVEAAGNYGFLLQIAVKNLMGKNGWQTASDILDRLFGKPVQAIAGDVNIEHEEPPVIVFREHGPEPAETKPTEEP